MKKNNEVIKILKVKNNAHRGAIMISEIGENIKKIYIEPKIDMYGEFDGWNIVDKDYAKVYTNKDISERARKALEQEQEMYIAINFIAEENKGYMIGRDLAYRDRGLYYIGKESNYNGDDVKDGILLAQRKEDGFYCCGKERILGIDLIFSEIIKLKKKEISTCKCCCNTDSIMRVLANIVDEDGSNNDIRDIRKDAEDIIHHIVHNIVFLCDSIEDIMVNKNIIKGCIQLINIINDILGDNVDDNINDTAYTMYCI